MAGSQTGSAITQGNFAIEVSTSGTAWIAICGEATNIAISGGDQPVGELMTACGTNAVVLGSKKQNPWEIVVTAVYTETASTEAFDYVFDRFNGTVTPKTLAVRWAPSGGTAAPNKVFNTSNSGTAIGLVPILRCMPPTQDASSADPAVFEFAVRSPALFETAGTT